MGILHSYISQYEYKPPCLHTRATIPGNEVKKVQYRIMPNGMPHIPKGTDNKCNTQIPD